MNKAKIINYIERLEASARQTDTYFKERNDLYIENQRLKDRIEKAKSFISLITRDKMFDIRSDNGEIDSLLNILNGRSDE